MTVGVSDSARAGWGSLSNRDFLAVFDLMSLVDEARDTGFWGHVDVACEYEQPYAEFKVIVRDRVTSVLDVDGWELIAVGRPT